MCAISFPLLKVGEPAGLDHVALDVTVARHAAGEHRRDHALERQ